MKCVGTCSLCHGRVLLPSVWHGVNPPVPQCESCRATPAIHGPVIDMKPAKITLDSKSERYSTGDIEDKWL